MGDSRNARIVILGGGFGGRYTALELERVLARRNDLEVTLVNRENFFLFTPMLHEVAASDLDVTPINLVQLQTPALAETVGGRGRSSPNEDGLR